MLKKLVVTISMIMPPLTILVRLMYNSRTELYVVDFRISVQKPAIYYFSLLFQNCSAVNQLVRPQMSPCTIKENWGYKKPDRRFVAVYNIFESKLPVKRSYWFGKASRKRKWLGSIRLKSRLVLNGEWNNYSDT